MARAAPQTQRQQAASGAVLAATIAVIAVLGLAIFELSNWDKITPGVSAMATPIGGLAQAEAVSRLTPSVQQLLDRPLEIRGADQVWPTTARDLGLRLDPNEIAAAAYQIGRQGSPTDRLGEQIDVFLHGRTVTVASTTDQAALDTSISGMAKQIERAPHDAKLSLARDGGIESTSAQAGLAVDIAASRDQVTSALNTSGRTVNLVTRPIPPAISDEQFSTARGQLERLLGPGAQTLTLTFGQQAYTLERADLLKLLSLSGGTKPGQPAVVNVDEAPLKAWAAKMARDIDQPVQDARFRFNGGNLQVLRPSKQGRSVDQSAVVQQVHDALLAGEMNLQLPVDVTEPSVSSDNPQALGITELIDRGSTSFAGSIPEKKHNIQLAAQRLNGVVVAPGATFSFNQEIGPTTLDAGFQWGFAITSGDNGPKTIPSVAGGICQVATTLFQPVFWSGYQLEERHWHLYWIPAYTSRNVVGLDVTVDPDSSLDFKWINTTGNYVLIQADADAERVYFGLYGKKPSWTVQVDDAVITNRTPPDPKPIAQEEPTLPWGRTLLVETARDGFDVEVTRRVVPTDGAKPRELNLKSSYQPAHTVTLVGSANKPAGASIDEAIQHVLEAQRQAAEPKPSPTPEAAATAAPAPASQPTAQPTAVPKPGAPAPTPVPATQPTAAPKPPAPTPTPKPR
ncbi:MAG TPA: VanW family protein [Chloroflexota bacterium]|nr:VanW family protein [Chloroflexota bacterium]